MGLLLLVSSICNTSTPPVRHTITTFVRQIEPITKASQHEELLSALEKPGRVNRLLIKDKLYNAAYLPGLLATYGGFVTQSDHNGEIIFPRLSEQNEIRCVFTQKVRPVIFRGSTIKHFVVDPETPISLYKFKRIHDTEHNVYVWEIIPEELGPSHQLQPLDMVFFVKPKHVILEPHQLIVTHNDVNMVLPDILVKKKIRPAYSALNFVKASKYFAPVQYAYRTAPDRYAQQLVN